MARTATRPRNDPGQYDDLAAEWTRPHGRFAALHWLAASRGPLIPPPPRDGAVLVDVACGGGLLAAHVPGGYQHVGVDVTSSALAVARQAGVACVQGDAARLPLGDRCADVVVAGEVFEHVADLETVVAEVARVLRSGGTLVFDTIADTVAARVGLVSIGERLPGGPPQRIHDPALFVSPARLRALCARHSIDVRMWGLRPSVPDYLAFLASRGRAVRMLRTRSLAGVYQGVGRKA